MVVETFERIEAAYVQRYGRNSSKRLAWDGFTMEVFVEYVLRSCSKKSAEVIERLLWERYDQFMQADANALDDLLQRLDGAIGEDFSRSGN